MPRKRKIKPKNQKTAEEFFPIDKDDLKHAIEKVVLPSPPQTSVTTTVVVKKSPEKKPRIKKTVEKIENKEFSPENITLKKDGYELVITEKPQAAMKIANSLGKAIGKDVKGVPYYEVDRQGKKIIVACAVGHLFTLKQSNQTQKNSNGQNFPVFDVKWVPNYLALKKDFTKRYYDVLAKLAKGAGTITVATDYDVEGEVIGLNIVRFICSQKDASRMKFSTLTDKELNDAYESKMSSINWGQAIAGETRHYLDWFYGINLSRALMAAIKSAGSFRIMSIGRVQGPSLNLIVKKEREIQAFKPKTYWQVFIQLKKPKVELKYNKDIFNKAELKGFENLKGKKAQVSTEKTQQIIPPNPPFNLTTLQTEVYAFHGISPSNTLRAAQSLYLAGLISYPRTSSQKLPSSLGYESILKKVAQKFDAEHLIKRNNPVEGKKTDPAHPSIYPTGNFQELEGDQLKVYNLIAKRFLALFCNDAIIDNKTVKAEVNNLVFSAKGSSVNSQGWMAIYPTKIIEKSIPDVNGLVEIESSRTEEKETQPPRRFSEASIISELEKRNLGTKATRASIIETLYDRGYIKEKSIEATPFGISLISTLEKHSPIIIDEQLTRGFEKDMEAMLQSKKEKDLEKKEESVKEKAKETIRQIAKQFETEGKAIGEELIKGNQEAREIEKEKNKIMPCPVCQKGELAITYSRKNRKFFIACNAYPNCKTTYSLPPYGLIKKIDKVCEKCGFPLLMSLRKGKKPWIFCFNRDCPTNKERLEEYRKKKEEESNNY